MVNRKLSNIFKIIDEADAALFRLIFFRGRNRLFDVLMPALSLAGNRGVLWIAIAALSFAFGGMAEKTAAVAALVSVAVAGVIAEFTIKMFLKRSRPFTRFDDVEPKVRGRRFRRRPSFPSGHSAGYFAGAYAYACFFPQYGFWFYLVAFLGAYSRIYNGVHFPGDVIAGSAIGVLVGWLICG